MSFSDFNFLCFFLEVFLSLPTLFCEEDGALLLWFVLASAEGATALCVVQPRPSHQLQCRNHRHRSDVAGSLQNFRFGFIFFHLHTDSLL